MGGMRDKKNEPGEETCCEKKIATGITCGAALKKTWVEGKREMV